MTVGDTSTGISSVRIQTKGLAYLLIPLVKKIEFILLITIIRKDVSYMR